MVGDQSVDIADVLIGRAGQRPSQDAPGLGVGVDTAVTEPWTAVGRYGWTGGAGTSGSTDPSRDLIGVVLSQRFMAGPRENFSYFWEPLATAL